MRGAGTGLVRGHSPHFASGGPSHMTSKCIVSAREAVSAPSGLGTPEMDMEALTEGERAGTLIY